MKSRKRSRPTGPEALGDVAAALQGIRESMSAPLVMQSDLDALPTTPERLSQAVKMIAHNEPALSNNEKGLLIKLFSINPRAADAYLALVDDDIDEEVRVCYLQAQLSS